MKAATELVVILQAPACQAVDVIWLYIHGWNWNWPAN